MYLQYLLCTVWHLPTLSPWQLLITAMELVSTILELLSPVLFKRMNDISGTYDSIRQDKDKEDMMEDKQKATTAVEIVRSENNLSLALPKH